MLFILCSLTTNLNKFTSEFYLKGCTNIFSKYKYACRIQPLIRLCLVLRNVFYFERMCRAASDSKRVKSKSKSKTTIDRHIQCLVYV